jgi:hypothetical protein
MRRRSRKRRMWVSESQRGLAARSKDRLMNFESFWKWLCLRKRVVRTVGYRSRFSVIAAGCEGAARPFSTNREHQFTLRDAKAVWRRYRRLPPAERFMAGRYVDGPRAHNWNPCPNRYACPWLAAAIRDFEAGVP